MLGQMMEEQPKAKAGNPNWVSDKPNSATLAEQGIDKNLGCLFEMSPFRAL
jgi:hypothetical protein